MSSTTKNRIIHEILSTIEIPEAAYETAERRYHDLGSWFGRSESNCSPFNPHIFPQGSFRLGTVIHPLNEDEPYDLDLACKLENGISKHSCTQEQLKTLVGLDVESYRGTRSIQKPKHEKHRCWRLEYADRLNFHMDIVPCIPEEPDRRRLLQEMMVRAGSSEPLAQAVANLTVCITDDRHPRYRTLSGDWNISNPDGYSRWFESRMRLATTFLEERMLEVRAVKIDDLPTYRWKTPLQQCVQVLKRHRDIVFANSPDLKPVSIIITTLAGRAYQGEADLAEAMERCLSDMGGLVNRQSPRVPNPVDPEEDFADRWSTSEGRAMKLEGNFWAWLNQARADFEVISSSTDARFLAEQAKEKFGARLDASDMRQILGAATPIVGVFPKSHRIVESPARPWRR